jgi:hypothetical protein
MIIWVCQDVNFNESTNDPNGSLAGAGTIKTVNKLLRNSAPRTNRTFNTITPYKLWYIMVAEYTNRKLTFATDKLPALSGLASAVAEHDQGKYLAGIWWEDLAFGICWKKVSLLSKYDEYIAPSWSWASVEGPIEFIDAHEVYFSQTRLTLMTPVIFHDSHVEPWGSNKYGRVKDAWIKLEAPMAALDSADGETFQISGMESPAEKAEISFDFDSDNKGELAALFLMRRVDNSRRSSSKEDVLDVILFGLIIRVVQDPIERYRALGLQDGSKVYERVGFFRISTPPPRESALWERNVDSIILV